MQERRTITRADADSDQQKTRVRTDPRDTIAFVAELASRYELKTIQPLLHVCQSAAVTAYLNIAVLDRFKAGKSSFLNHFAGRDLLPVGVVPVTAVITALQWGPEDQAEVHFLKRPCQPHPDRTDRGIHR
jgi:hypothetical protein